MKPRKSLQGNSFKSPHRSPKSLNLHNFSMEEIMREKWDLQAAIKSSLQLFGERNKFNSSVENPSEEEQQRDEDSDTQPLTKQQRKIRMLRKRYTFGHFKDQCMYIIRRRHIHNAAKYLYQQKVMRKVLLSKSWSMEADQKIGEGMGRILRFLDGRKKKEGIMGLQKLLQSTRDEYKKKTRVEWVVKRRLFLKRKEERMRSRSIHQQKREVEAVRRLKTMARFVNKQQDRPQKTQIQQQMVLRSRYLKQQQPHTERESLKQKILIDDIRNQLERFLKGMFFHNLTLRLAGKRMERWREESVTHAKEEFLRLLRIRASQQRTRDRVVDHRGQQLIRALEVTPRFSKLFESASKKHHSKLKRLVFKSLQAHREKNMVRTLCVNIIASKKIHQLQDKAFKALQLNLGRKRTGNMLCIQLERRTNFKTLQKCFNRWKYYRPEYLDEIRVEETLEIEPRREREETGASDLLSKEIRTLTHTVFIKRFVTRMREDNERKLVMDSCEVLFDSFVGEKLKKRQKQETIQMLRRGLMWMRKERETRQKQHVVQEELRVRSLHLPFSQKWFPPEKEQRLRRRLRMTRLSHCLSGCLSHIRIKRLVNSKTRRVVGGRLFGSLIARHEERSEVERKVKYSRELILKLRELKQKHRLFQQLAASCERSLKTCEINVSALRLKREFTTSMNLLHLNHSMHQRDKRLSDFIHESRCLKFFSHLRNNGESTHLLEGQSQLLFSLIKTLKMGAFLDHLEQAHTIRQTLRQRSQILSSNVKQHTQKSFINHLTLASEDSRQSRVNKITTDRLQAYATKRHQTTLTIKAFAALKLSHRQSQTSKNNSLLLTAFQALKANRIQGLLLRRYLLQHKNLSYYPSSQSQYEEFHLLRLSS